jgi:hypothetical protein
MGYPPLEGIKTLLVCFGIVVILVFVLLLWLAFRVGVQKGKAERRNNRSESPPSRPQPPPPPLD